MNPGAHGNRLTFLPFCHAFLAMSQQKWQKGHRNLQLENGLHSSASDRLPSVEMAGLSWGFMGVVPFLVICHSPFSACQTIPIVCPLLAILPSTAFPGLSHNVVAPP